ncbi:MAG: UDP-glucose-4-epimerase GalE [Pseudohongiellaceae bacterium]|jgi:UDP-glucose-4-epimerase GalE
MVTGGAGYIGSHAVRALRERGHEVVVFDNLSEGFADAVLGAPLVEADILDTPALEQALREYKVEAVLHFAARCYVGESMEKPELYWRINRDGTRSLLEAMAMASVDKLVFSSTCAVYGSPPTVPIPEDCPRAPVNVYGETKMAMEDEIRSTTAVTSVIFRYFNAAGASEDAVLGERHDPETHLIPLALRAARDGGVLTVFGDDYDTPDGTCIRDYIHVCDLADAHVLGVERLLAGGSSLLANLGYGQGHSVLELAETVRRVTGLSLNVQLGPRRAGDPPQLFAGGDKVRRELGWTPSRDQIDLIVRHAWAALPS